MCLGGNGGVTRQFGSPGRTRAGGRLATKARETTCAGLQTGHRTPGKNNS